MIHQVPIKSLPQEWLWCETWCDDTSKAKAKTIDLVSIFPSNFHTLHFIRKHLHTYSIMQLSNQPITWQQCKWSDETQFIPKHTGMYYGCLTEPALLAVTYKSNVIYECLADSGFCHVNKS